MSPRVFLASLLLAALGMFADGFLCGCAVLAWEAAHQHTAPSHGPVTARVITLAGRGDPG